jgi:hypothetical protein
MHQGQLSREAVYCVSVADVPVRWKDRSPISSAGFRWRALHRTRSGGVSEAKAPQESALIRVRRRYDGRRLGLNSPPHFPTTRARPFDSQQTGCAVLFWQVRGKFLPVVSIHSACLYIEVL